MANATLRIWWFTNYDNKGFAATELLLGASTLPFWAIQFRRPQKAFGFGHASLHIPMSTIGQTVIPSQYISWGGGLSPEADTDNYGIQPETYTIPLVGAGTAFGLNADGIRQWYAGWQANPSYNLVTRNCCDCVVGALEAGGGSYYSPIGTKWLGYDGARTVQSWTKRILARVTEMNTNWQNSWNIAKPIIERGRAAAGRVNTDDLFTVMPGRAAAQLGNQINQVDRAKWTTVPSFQEWKKRSAVFIGARKEQILMMDQLLQNYDRIRNADPELRDRNNFFEKANTLKSLVMWAADHIRSKPNSDRKDAVLPLANAAWIEHNRIAAANRCMGGRHMDRELIV